MEARRQAPVRPFYEQPPPLRNRTTEADASSQGSSQRERGRRQRVKARIKEELQLLGRNSLDGPEQRPPNLVPDADGHLHDRDYLKEWKERSYGTPSHATETVSRSSSDSESDQDDPESPARRHSFQSIRMPGLPPGVSTLPSNVSVSGHVLPQRNDNYAPKSSSQLRLTAGTYASRPQGKPSTLTHSKRNSVLAPNGVPLHHHHPRPSTGMAEPRRSTTSREYTFKQDPAVTEAKQRLSKDILSRAPPSIVADDRSVTSTPSLGASSSKAASSSRVVSSKYPASTFTAASSREYNPFSYIPKAAVQRHRSEALKAAQRSMSSTPKDSTSPLQRPKLSAAPTLSILDGGSSVSSNSMTWDDPIDLATLRDESSGTLQLDYVPSLEHPEWHRSSAHQPHVGGIVVPAGVEKGVSNLSRNWQKTKLDVRFAMLRAKRTLKN